jgi:hypothetical protein
MTKTAMPLTELLQRHDEGDVNGADKVGQWGAAKSSQCAGER